MERWLEDSTKNKQDKQKPPRIGHELPWSDFEKANDGADEQMERKPNSFF